MGLVTEDKDGLIEEALIENEARNEYNRRQAKEVKNRPKQSRWLKLISRLMLFLN